MRLAKRIVLNPPASSNSACQRQGTLIASAQRFEFPAGRRTKMAFCSKCGAQLAGEAAFCASCGQPQGTAPTAAGSQSGLAENVAGLLCYSLGWLTGLIFLLIDRRPSVQFHAAQS